jgi:GTP cyclohydrolase II
MTLSPDIVERLARARADLRMGVPVVLQGADSAALVFAAETLSAQRLAQLRVLGGQPVLAITDKRAETLKARAYDGDVARVVLPADAALDWVHGVADPADDLKSPMKGPLVTSRSGSADLHRIAITLAKSARLLPAAVVLGVPSGAVIASQNDLTLINTLAAAPVLTASSPLHAIISASLPLEVSEAGRLHVFRPEDGGEEHYAVEIGKPMRDVPVLARLHSACFTGDLLGSLKCDCGPQLRGALAQMGEEGAGVLLYLNQEGRGIGLANKMRAYSLQDQGFDTVEANHRLGFEDDERDFRIGADILKAMGFSAVRLLTNNPAKIAMMEANGITVTERVPLKVGHTRQNAHYLATKAKKSGHLL